MEWISKKINPNDIYSDICVKVKNYKNCTIIRFLKKAYEMLGGEHVVLSLSDDGKLFMKTAGEDEGFHIHKTCSKNFNQVLSVKRPEIRDFVNSFVKPGREGKFIVSPLKYDKRQNAYYVDLTQVVLELNELRERYRSYINEEDK